MRTFSKIVRILPTISLTLLLGWGAAWLLNSGAPVVQPAHAQTPECYQPWLTPPFTNSVYLPVVIGANPARPGTLFAADTLPLCTAYCGMYPEDDAYRPAGHTTYFADEFNCNRLLAYWVRQPQMSAAAYRPPANGQVEVSQGTLKLGVWGQSASFPYLYLVDDSATTYDIPYQVGDQWVKRVDWLPDTADFRLAMRVRFLPDTLGEHRIAIYVDGHHPAYAGPLFYLGSDYNGREEAWRGLIVGADRGASFVDLGEHGYPDPYREWVVFTADFNYSQDTMILAVDDTPVLTRTLSTFQGYPQAAIRPDILYLGSLAMLPSPVLWTDLEIDWLRVYAPPTLPTPPYGLITPTIEFPPQPIMPATEYAAALPPGPFDPTPYWAEDFDEEPNYWQLMAHPDPLNSWTYVADSAVTIDNNGQATGVPVWAIYDDLLPTSTITAQTISAADARETPAEYLERRGGNPLHPSGSLTALDTDERYDWRPNSGNIRYAWRALQTADGYGVEVSNAGHRPYFTGALFYTLQDNSSNGGTGQFIFPGCQEQYFWRLHLLPEYQIPHDRWVTTNADYINGTVHLYVDGIKIGWWPESDCSLNWYLKGQNATQPEVLFFGNPATGPPGGWSKVSIDWFATFAGLPEQTDWVK